jgi:hypothetical protein
MVELGPVRHRRTIRTWRTHLWLSSLWATLCFTGVVLLASVLRALSSPSRGNLPPSEATDLARHFDFLIHSAIWPLLPLALAGSIVTAHVLFRRMREPLVRFVRCYEAIAEGAVPPQIALRATDYLADEADALNGMIASLRHQQIVRNDAVARLEEAISDLAVQKVPESILSDLQDVAKRLSASRSGFEQDPGPRRGAP